MAEQLAEPWNKKSALLVAQLLFFASLNWVDFVTDIMVLLQLSCITSSNVKQECEYANFTCESGIFCSYANITLTDQDEDKCVVHVAWCLLGAIVLIVSSIASAVAYSAEIRLEPSRKSIWLGFFAALFQIAPFLDILHVVRTRTLDEKKRQQMLRRDFVLKLAESVPQAMLQSYIMFASATHVQPLNLLSVTSSVSSVSLSLALQLPKITPRTGSGSEAFDQPLAQVQTYGVCRDAQAISDKGLEAGDAVPDRPEAREEDVKISIAPPVLSPFSPLHDLVLCKFMFFIYLASDLVLRCAAYAMLWAPVARHLGLAMGLGFAMCQSVAGYHSVLQKRSPREVKGQSLPGFICMLSLSFLVGFAYAYVMPFAGGMGSAVLFFLILPAWVLPAVPVVLTFERPYRDKAAFMVVRGLEYVSFGTMLAVNGRTFCGKPLGWETLAFFALLGLNLVALKLYGAMHYSEGLQQMLQKLERYLLVTFSCGALGASVLATE